MIDEKKSNFFIWILYDTITTHCLSQTGNWSKELIYSVRQVDGIKLLRPIRLCLQRKEEKRNNNTGMRIWFWPKPDPGLCTSKGGEIFKSLLNEYFK